MYLGSVKYHVDDGREEEAEVLAKSFLNEDQAETCKKEIGEILEEVIRQQFDDLESDGAVQRFLIDTACSRVEAFLEKVLKGDEEATKELFGCGWRSRYRTVGFSDVIDRPWSRVIHGSIFETDVMKLRRRIVEANVDLLKDERILDLESQVEGLRKQIVDLEGRRQ